MSQLQFSPVIGLEVHVELSTSSKMFCRCSAEHFGVEPNTHTCPVCLGLPGALPVPNRKAVEWTIMLGLALNCRINQYSKFDRKNYFYPDLPKGYQISQYDLPLCVDGSVDIKVGDKSKTIRIRRIHQEEDTGKLQHAELDGEKVSLVDFNRSGVPLTEIVTEPDFETIEEVDQYLKKLQKIIRYLGISGADMEKGSMRLEPSISMRPLGTRSLPPYRVELKNINSFRFARKALEYEIKRQTEILQKGETPVQQTRGWNELKASTVPQREKEEANDYRYFPEPDIPPMEFSDAFITSLRDRIPELPDAKTERFLRQYGLNEYSAGLLTSDITVADYFEQAFSEAAKLAELKDSAKEISNWIINKKFDISVTVPAQLVQMIYQSRKTTTVNETELERVIDEAIKNNPQAVKDFTEGKTAAMGVILGTVFKSISGDKNLIIEKVREKLSKYS